MIKLRNKELIEKQKEKGPTLTLKQKEELLKEQKHNIEAAEMRKKRREQSEKSKAERDR